jgi:hypothetical protein
MRERKEACRERQGCGTDREEEIWGCGAGRKRGRYREEEGAETEMRGRAGGSDGDAGQEGETRMRGRVGEAERRRKKWREDRRSSREKVEEAEQRSKKKQRRRTLTMKNRRKQQDEVRKRGVITINRNGKAM